MRRAPVSPMTPTRTSEITCRSAGASSCSKEPAMKRLAVLLTAVIALPLFAADPPCDVSTLDKALDCRVDGLERAFHDAALTTNDNNAKNAAVSKVANSTRATTPPDAFAARIHNSYQDFLVPLSF